ncbi:unnamed protein product [Urochloa humidicola]
MPPRPVALDFSFPVTCWSELLPWWRSAAAFVWRILLPVCAQIAESWLSRVDMRACTTLFAPPWLFSLQMSYWSILIPT